MTSQIFDFFIQTSVNHILDIKSGIDVKEEPDCDANSCSNQLTSSCFSITTIKTEPVKNDTVADSVTTVKLQPEVAAAERCQYVYKCRICKSIFQSKINLTLHGNKDAKRCVNCWSQFLEQLDC